jgi:hypothetical protein
MKFFGWLFLGILIVGGYTLVAYIIGLTAIIYAILLHTALIVIGSIILVVFLFVLWLALIQFFLSKMMGDTENNE